MSTVAQARALRKQGSPAEAARLLADLVRRGALTAEQLPGAGRLIATMLDGGELPPPGLRVHLLGQVTTSFLLPVLTATCWGRNQPAAVSEGGYDQIFQDLMSLSPGEKDVLVLLPWTQRLLGSERPGQDRIADELAFWQQAWSRAAALGCRVVQVGYALPGDGPLGSFQAARGDGPRSVVRRANEALLGALPDGAFFVDLDALAGTWGGRMWDPRGWTWAKQPFSDEGLLPLANAIHAGVRAVTTGPKKVLVLDLDNTLWGGVVGETGPLGVGIGEDADGEAFRLLQRWCQALTRRGVLLAVASKNEPDDARAPFEHNPGMVLKLDDFAAFEAHWSPKSESLRRIAEQLNLGLDSLVFVDDNPAEREQIRQAQPEVEVVDLPADPAGYIAAIEAGRWFDTVALTAEDAQRSRQYAEERQRRELQSGFDDLDAYLESLQMRGEIRPVDAADLPRVVQLLAKTNQWNLTTRRHGPELVQAVMDDPRAVALTLRLEDRFGDHGLVAVALALPRGDALHIDTWLMSCRVIARTAEQFLLADLVERARELGHAALIGEYLPTKKNRQVADLYERFGFSAHGPAATPEGTLWRADLADYAPPPTLVRPR